MKKNLGLYISAKPHFGGLYQYTQSIVTALSTLDQGTFEITCFCSSRSWFELLPARFNKIHVRNEFSTRIFSGLLKRMFPSITIWRLAGRFSNIVKTINNSSCHIIIYPGQDLASWQSKKPSIVAIHDLMHRYEPSYKEYNKVEYKKRELLYDGICKYAHLILTDSELGKAHVIDSYNSNPNKIKVLPFTPPVYLLTSQIINVFKRYSLPKKYIFYPAQFWSHKNHVNLLKAVYLLKKDLKDIHLVLVGSKQNGYSDAIIAINNLELKNQVTILGYVPSEEMYSLYKSATAMVFVSVCGPTNIPPMEAFVTGCPLICSNTYAMPDQVGTAALLINPRDPLDIAKQIKSIWNDEALQKKLISAGFEQAKKYTQESFDRLFYAYITEALATI